jgi:hypothetical protein
MCAQMLLSLKQTVPPIIEPITLAQLKQHLRIDSGYTDDDALLTALITGARQYAENYTRRAFFNQTWVRTMDHFPTNYFISATVNPSLRRDWPYYAGLWWNLTIALPVARLLSVESVTYLDQTGAQQTLALDDLYIDYNSEPARITPPPGGLWPFTEFYVPGSVAITYTTGSFVTSVEESATVPSSTPYTYTPLQGPVTAVTSATDGNGNVVSTSYSATTGNVTFNANVAGETVTLNYYIANAPQPICQAMLLLCGQWYEHKEASSMTNLYETPFAVRALLDMYVVNVMDYDAVV